VKRMIEKKGKLKGEITLVLELTKFGADWIVIGQFSKLLL
jgi:hypothetical protein